MFFSALLWIHSVLWASGTSLLPLQSIQWEYRTSQDWGSSWIWDDIWPEDWKTNSKCCNKNSTRSCKWHICSCLDIMIWFCYSQIRWFSVQFHNQVLSEERVTGTVTTELRSEGSGGDTQGRISYENRGECFFLPYNKDDVEGNVTLCSGDKVSFQIATNQR